MSDRPNFFLGIVRREKWQRLREISVDGNEFPEDFTEWVRLLAGAENELNDKGYEVTPVEIDLDALCYWCSLNNVAVNAASRNGFAAVTFYLSRLETLADQVGREAAKEIVRRQISSIEGDTASQKFFAKCGLTKK